MRNSTRSILSKLFKLFCFESVQNLVVVLKMKYVCLPVLKKSGLENEIRLFASCSNEKECQNRGNSAKHKGVQELTKSA